MRIKYLKIKNPDFELILRVYNQVEEEGLVLHSENFEVDSSDHPKEDSAQNLFQEQKKIPEMRQRNIEPEKK